MAKNRKGIKNSTKDQATSAASTNAGNCGKNTTDCANASDKAMDKATDKTSGQ